MKKLVQATLALSTLISLNACGGQVAPTGGMPYSPNMVNGQGFAQNPYMQTGYSYQAPQQQAPQSNPMMAQPQQPAQPQFNQQPQQSAPRSAAGPQSVSLRSSASRPAPQLPPQQVAPRPAAPVQQQQAAPRQSAESIAADLLVKTRQKFDQIQNFATTIDAFEKNEKGVTRLKLKVLYQKPTATKLEILEHSNGMFAGARLRYESGIDQVTGRPGGMLGVMKLTVPMSDDRITSRRGYRLDQIDTMAIVQRLVNPALNPKVLGKTSVGGREIIVLEFPAQNHFDPAITREILGIDMQEHFIRIHEMYAGPELVYSLKLQDVQINAPLSAKDFDI